MKKAIRQPMSSALLAGDELVDGRVDRGVLTADAHAGDEAAHQEDPHVRRQAGQCCAHQVDHQGHREHLLAAEGVGEPAEQQGPGHLAEEVDGAGQANIGRAHVQGLLEATRRDDLDLQAVEDPRGAKAEDHHPVESRPRHVVHPSRDQTLDRPVLRCC
jgi:hypothetical protein